MKRFVQKWNECDIPIFQTYRDNYSVQCDQLVIYCVNEKEMHYDAFSIIGNILNYDAAMEKQYNLTQEESLACITHKLGHGKDLFPIAKDDEEIEKTCRYIREFHADEEVSRLKQEDALISALRKMPQVGLLTSLRIKRLKELKRKRESENRNTKVTSIGAMVFALLLRDNGYSEWDGKNHSQADSIVRDKDGCDFFWR